MNPTRYQNLIKLQKLQEYIAGKERDKLTKVIECMETYFYDKIDL